MKGETARTRVWWRWNLMKASSSTTKSERPVWWRAVESDKGGKIASRKARALWGASRSLGEHVRAAQAWWEAQVVCLWQVMGIDAMMKYA